MPRDELSQESGIGIWIYDNLPWCAIHSPRSITLGRALNVMRFPFTICLEYDGLSHMGKGPGFCLAIVFLHTKDRK